MAFDKEYAWVCACVCARETMQMRSEPAWYQFHHSSPLVLPTPPTSLSPGAGVLVVGGWASIDDGVTMRTHAAVCAKPPPTIVVVCVCVCGCAWVRTCIDPHSSFVARCDLNVCTSIAEIYNMHIPTVIACGLLVAFTRQPQRRAKLELARTHARTHHARNYHYTLKHYNSIHDKLAHSINRISGGYLRTQKPSNQPTNKYEQKRKTTPELTCPDDRRTLFFCVCVALLSVRPPLFTHNRNSKYDFPYP